MTTMLSPEPFRALIGRHAPLRCVVVGAGEAGQSMARDLLHTPEYGLDPVGFLDDAVDAVTEIAGLPRLGAPGDMVDVVQRFAIDVVVVSIPSLPPRALNRLARLALSAGVGVRYLPSFLAAVERDMRVTDLRKLRLDELLGRDEVRVVRPGTREVVHGKRVLVTGAGGSIGSELCRQISAFEPAALFMLDHDESNLHGLQMRLEGHALLDSDEVIIGDIRDRDRIRQVIRDTRPQVVFHAAAHKHLPLLERHPCEGVKSNVLGTQNLVDCSLAAGVDRFIFISTDKAADPTSVLGATKRLGEMIVSSAARHGGRFASVRFGNVLGSRGSFLSVICDQIEAGEPVTVTHPDVRRFFMTVEEAVGLVLEAAAMVADGETFVLDMGEPVRILDLVRNVARQLHLDEGDVPLRFTGLRAGEKVDEALISNSEVRVPTDHPKVWEARSDHPPLDPQASLAALYAVAADNDADAVRRHLGDLLPNYTASAGDSEELIAAFAAPYPEAY